MPRDIKLVFWDNYYPGTEMEYAFDAQLNVIEGRESLIQNIVKNILTLKGSNAFDITIGSTFPAIPGSSLSKDSSDILKTSLILALKTLEDDIKKRQRVEEDAGEIITDREKLQKISLKNAKFLLADGAWKITIDVYTEDETISTISLPL